MIATSAGPSTARAEPARAWAPVPQVPARAAPQVSSVVRSMGSPELRDSLGSPAAQDYPSIEVIAVDATGGAHPPLPPIEWRPGHSIRVIAGGHRLGRASAAARASAMALDVAPLSRSRSFCLDATP